jgi:hypothetical protein
LPGLPNQPGKDAVRLRPVVPPSSCHRRWLPYPLSHLGASIAELEERSEATGASLTGRPCSV